MKAEVTQPAIHKLYNSPNSLSSETYNLLSIMKILAMQALNFRTESSFQTLGLWCVQIRIKILWEESGLLHATTTQRLEI
jgi:hypothetical protein